MSAITQLEAEVAWRERTGWIRISVAKMVKELEAIGYRLDRRMDCKSMATWRTGDRAGESYPANSLTLRQIDDGKSAFHFEARRDSNYESIKKFRNTHFAISGGYIMEI